MNREQMQAILGFLPSDEQWAAITAPLNAPMLVLAGAGSGKTAVMSARIVWAVSTGRIAPEQVLGLTFTHKAAGELATRTRTYLDALHLSEDTGDPAISTFHAFAVDLIAEFGLLAGAEPSATLLSPTDLAQATFRSVVGSRVPCEDFGTGHIDTVRQRVQSLDEQLSEHLCAPEDLRKFDRRLIEDLATQSGADAQKTVLASRRRILASQVVEEVRADRAASAQVGFADLMRLAALISRMPLVSAQLRERYRMVLVDEYQDTSVAQADVLASLFGSGHPLTAVGDPLQAIYGWRGASVANIDGFPQAFGARVRPLTVNRRSGERILDAAEVRFARSGYDATSLGDIADDVGIRTPSLYKHFESKRDLYVAVVERLLSPYFELLDRLLTVPEDAEQAEKNLFAVTRFYLETPNLARVVQHAALAGGEELELLVERWYLPLFRRATQLTETAPLLAGEAKKALSVVIAFHSMMSRCTG